MYKNFYGYNKESITLPFKSKEQLIGKPVTVKSSDGVSVCEEGDSIFGVISDQNRNYITVQLDGYIELPCSEQSSMLGFKSISADGTGGVKADENGTPVWIIRHDAESGIVGLLIK